MPRAYLTWRSDQVIVLGIDHVIMLGIDHVIMLGIDHVIMLGITITYIPAIMCDQAVLGLAHPENMPASSQVAEN
jgi:hypothetical protein